MNIVKDRAIITAATTTVIIVIVAAALSSIPFILILGGGAAMAQEEEQDDNNANNNNDSSPLPVIEDVNAVEASHNAVMDETKNGNSNSNNDDDDEVGGGISQQDDTITTATPETGIVTEPLANTQLLAESESGTPLGPEVANPGVDPRVSLQQQQSIKMQEYNDFQAALAQNGYNFNDNGVTYSQSYTDGRTVMIIMGTQSNTDQPPAMILDQLATSWGFQMLAYAYNTQGQLVTVFLEMF